MAKNNKLPTTSLVPNWKVAATTKYLISGTNWSSCDDELCNISLKYFYAKYQCFSKRDNVELKAFSSFLEKVQSQNWLSIKTSWRKSWGSKNGLWFTTMPSHLYRGKISDDIFSYFSPDVSLSEMRVSEVARVHWFRSWPNYFLILLDNQHDIAQG